MQLRNSRAPPRRRGGEAAPDRTDERKKKPSGGEEEERKKERSAPTPPVAVACTYCVWVRAARAQTLAAATAGSVRFVRRRVPRRKRGRGQPPMCGVRCRRGLNGGEAEAVPRPGRSAPYHQGVPGRTPPSATRARTGRWVHPPVPRAGQPPACESIRRGKARARRAAPNTGVLPQDTCASQVAEQSTRVAALVGPCCRESSRRGPSDVLRVWGHQSTNAREATIVGSTRPKCSRRVLPDVQRVRVVFREIASAATP